MWPLPQIIILLLSATKISSAPHHNKSGLHNRIVGGRPVPNRESFAYQVSLREDGQHICGGTIIDEYHILTACHCVSDGPNVHKPSLFTVAIGYLKLHDSRERLLKVKNIFTHDKFVPYTVQNDIALLRLETKILFDSRAQPIPLVNESLTEQTHCNVSGWGRTEHNHELSESLMFAEVDLISTRECKKSNVHGGDILQGMRCAGKMAGQVDSCEGDSGGPLVCRGQLTGIVSWGPVKCGKPNNPGVYTDIYYYRDWITNEMKRSGASQLKYSFLIILPYIVCLLLQR